MMEPSYFASCPFLDASKYSYFKGFHRSALNPSYNFAHQIVSGDKTRTTMIAEGFF
jgi:hypothetical protein